MKTTVVKFAKQQTNRVPLIKAIRLLASDYYNGIHRDLAWCRARVDDCELNLNVLGVTLPQAMVYLEPWVINVVQVDADGAEHIVERSYDCSVRTFSLPRSITYADREALANHLIELGNLIRNARFGVYPDA